jgi:hypothetical protein
MSELTGWAVYDHPRDYPQSFVARRWVGIAGKMIPTADMFVAETLDEVRALLPPGLVYFPRRRGDDPVIVETWL